MAGYLQMQGHGVWANVFLDQLRQHKLSAIQPVASDFEMTEVDTK